MAEIRGLDVFGQHFSEFRDQYVLIGGVASWLTMDEAGQSFRATKDLDIVLVIEALNPDFVGAFWEFVRAGGYAIRQVGEIDGKRPVFYRFQNPENEAYPAQLELFSRAPDGIEHPTDATLTPIPTDESVSSLSAILLDQPYYQYLLEGRHSNEQLTFIGADRLIPLKAHAWLDLSARKEAGEQIDSKNVRKHRNDILVLSGQLTDDPIKLPESIQNDMRAFVERLAKEEVDLNALKLKGTLEGFIERLTLNFGL
ncbi:hypothetical protein ACTXN4_09730 [Pseudomonas helleri]|uniref:Nucleotidyl transferase AbiEii/AbiGii toxin family protein n=1 Tax=Pseudomonas helleri TaxID=1608996 RepID=A0A7X1XDU5_9PSED|nr:MULTISPECIES: hypothetical protein [Pseudomonas]MQT73295.1 hypothetical protein [Pseudomonas helleri]MQT89687.1 hypothetical protein [Pseudomonas helleri]MQU03739.1 hypothetical protein [Pseudomonas sp. FSL R10-2245]